jgi:16S rRNA (guanine(966)-N(2))-methyltransferase RsmD
MRIVAGRFKGRRLRGPTGAGVRPTSDRLRETIYNVLGPALEGETVLDAFAGTGALGLEALSRGASAVTFVERDRREADVIAANVRACGASDACAIIRDDFLSPRAPRGRVPPSGSWMTSRYDLILLDPPYDVPDVAAILDRAGQVAAPGARVLLEHSRRRDAPAAAAGLRRTRVLESGDSAVSLYLAEPV